MTETHTVIELTKIGKSYGPVTALADVNIRFEGNRIYGLFGRNGAGKTTLLNLLTARIFADTGRVICAGRDVSTHPETMAGQCCYMPEKHYFPGRFTVRRLLAFAREAFPRFDEAEAERLCRVFALNETQKYEQLSRGYQSILRIVIGLAANAPITLFDEPVLGLDAVARDRFYLELIQSFSKHPRLFVLSTHLIEESADLFNEAIILDKGRVIRHASVEDLLTSAFYVTGNATLVDAFVKSRNVLSTQQANSMKTVVVEGNLNAEPPSRGLRFSPLTIQKLFIHLTHGQGGQE